MHIRRRIQKLRIERLEKRELLAADSLHSLLVPTDPSDQVLAVESVDHHASYDYETLDQLAGTKQQIVLDAPHGLPNQFTIDVPFEDSDWTLSFEKHSVFGANTRFLIDDGHGQLTEIERGPDRSYMGNVQGKSGYFATAQLTDVGLMASIMRPDGPTILIEPAFDSNSANHFIFLDPHDLLDHEHAHESDRTLTNAADTTPIGDLTTQPISHKIREFESADSDLFLNDPVLSRMGVADVYEFEVGVEIGSRAFFASSAYNGNLSIAQASAASVATNMDSRYLRATGIKHTLGTVIIRTNAATDPLRDSVVSTGAAPGANFSLSSFRDYWNSNPGEVGNTHDLAVYHVLSAPSGLAYVNSVGTSNRYATTGGNGATSWANGTVVHEFGHSWNLPHVGNGLFYESKPRNNNGSNSAGGEDVFVSIMHGGGDHNIGRMATDEANRVIAARQAKLNFGEQIIPGPVGPFGHRDTAFVGDGPTIIDVAANDYDVNNDVINVQLLDTVSQQGARIDLSVGTGPGGRNEIIYTPPAVSSGERDFFHYRVVDATGRSDWGAVYVDSASIGVDLAQDKYPYDFGTTDSPVFSDSTTQAVRVSPATTGDVAWSDPVQAIDRATPGQNAYNRDFVFGSTPVTWSHRIQNGRWRVVVNMSDPATNLDNMYVDAEGLPGLSNLDRPIGQNQTVAFEVDVLDGELNLEFGDADTVNPRWAVNRVVLEQLVEFVPPLLQGDFNRDGIVDAADFTLFRDDLGSSVSNPFDGADGNGNRIVDEADYTVWRDNFGATLVTTALINATSGNGEFAVDDPNDVSKFGGGTDDITIILERDRALRNTGQSGRGISILGWDLERVAYSGANAAFGTDGTYGFAPNPGVGAGQTGQAFVNSGAIEVRSEPISGDFSAGDKFEFSYLLGSDSGANSTVESTVTLIFDEGLPTEQSRTFDTRSATGLATPAIQEEYRLVDSASTLSIAFLLDGGVGIRTLLDRVELDWVTPSVQLRAPLDMVKTPDRFRSHIRPSSDIFADAKEDAVVKSEHAVAVQAAGFWIHTPTLPSVLDRIKSDMAAELEPSESQIPSLNAEGDLFSEFIATA